MKPMPGADHEARWWEPQEKWRVLCTLCPRFCSIPPGSKGFCTIRRNVGGKLVNTAYGRSTGFAVDPIEKKPLYHFYPGSRIFSFGTIGCNLGCKFCQNWHMSKIQDVQYLSQFYTPEEVVQLAFDKHCIGIAYTYNDPVIFAEWVIDIAKVARRRGMKNVLVTNGYITPEAREELYRYTDAVNVDLKSFTENFYKKLTLSELEPVLDTLRWLVHHSEVWTEITTLIIPGENDSSRELDRLTQFIAQELSVDIPLHFSAFHPDFKMMDYPATSVSTLKKARTIAQNNGMRYVYLGNVLTSEGQNTICPNCDRTVINRDAYFVDEPEMVDNLCRFCYHPIPGRFDMGEKPVIQNFNKQELS